MTEYSDLRQPPPSRRNLIRMALIHTPFALASLTVSVIAVVKIFEGEGNFLWMLIIFGSLGLLTGSQALQYLRDLTASPIEIQGEVVRKWHKGNLFFFFLPSYYITIDSKTFQGKVSRVDEKGAYIRLESGAEGFCRRKDLDIETKGRSTEEIVRPGQEISYKVTGVDGHGVYKLSCRKAEERSIVGKIFVIPRVEYAMLLELDLVKVTFFPHSASVERIDRYDESEKGFIPATTGATF